MNIRKLGSAFGIFVAAFWALSAFANGSAVTVASKLTNPIGPDTFSEFVSAVIKSAVEIMIPFVVISFIYSGFLFVKAQGKPKEIEDAQKAITWSIVGTFILFGAYGFSKIIETTVSTITSTTP